MGQRTSEPLQRSVKALWGNGSAPKKRPPVKRAGYPLSWRRPGTRPNFGPKWPARSPDGGKGRGRGECGVAKHGPDAEPGGRVTGAGPHTRSCHQEQERETDGAPASRHRRCASCRVVRLEATGSTGHGCGEWDMYEENREENLRDLHRRVRAGAYRAQPSRRTYIPKADGGSDRSASRRSRTRSSSVRHAVLTAIYEEEFLGFSWVPARDAASMMRWTRSCRDPTRG